MLNIVFTACLLIFSSVLYGQERDVQWSEVEMPAGTVIDIVSGDTSEVYILRYSGNNSIGYYTLERKVDGIEKSRKKINLNFDIGFTTIREIIYFNSSLYLVFSKKHHGQNFIYAQRINSELDYEDSYKELASYEINAFKQTDQFSILKSENDSLLGIQWSREVNKDLTNYGFSVYGSDFELINDGEYPIRIRNKYLRIDGGVLSNEGDYVLFFTEMTSERNRTASSNFSTLNIYLFNENGLDKLKYDFDSYRPLSWDADFSQEELVVGGTYSDFTNTGAIGMFNLRLNRNKLDEFTKKFVLFDDSTLQKIYSQQEYDQLERRMDRRNIENFAVNNFYIREFSVSNSGQVVCLLENFFIQTQSVSFGFGAANSMSYLYHYNDLLTFSFDNKDSLKWVNVISKNQVTPNSSAPLFGVFTIKTDSVWTMFFSENSNNFDENGKYISNVRYMVSEYSKRNQGVSIVELNIETGETKRELDWLIGEIEIPLMPRFFVLDKNKQDLFLYGKGGKRERVGRLKL